VKNLSAEAYEVQRLYLQQFSQQKYLAGVY
jgi:hypothetical protein